MLHERGIPEPIPEAQGVPPEVEEEAWRYHREAQELEKMGIPFAEPLNW